MTQQPKQAVLVAHGQPSDPAPQEAALAVLAAETAAFLDGREVQSATLSTPGRLETLAAPGCVIYPFFMSKGWFATKVVPDRLQEIPHRLACPFGLDPDLPPLAAAAIAAAAAAQGWQTAETHLLLAAHGSARGTKAAEAAEAFAAALRTQLPLAAVRTGYVEQAPRIADAARALPARALCLPFFAQSGDHVKNDLPEGLQDGGFAGPVLPAAGALPGVPQLIAAAIRAAA